MAGLDWKVSKAAVPFKCVGLGCRRGGEGAEGRAEQEGREGGPVDGGSQGRVRWQGLRGRSSSVRLWVWVKEGLLGRAVEERGVEAQERQLRGGAGGRKGSRRGRIDRGGPTCNGTRCGVL